MKILKQYVVDAFTDKVFTGNPAAVCLLDQWLPDELLLNIAKENNLSETAFSVPQDDGYHLRWFTPGGEIELCGHATLGTAYVITNFIEPGRTTIPFETMSGVLTVEKKGDLFEMNFPSYDMKEVPVTDAMTSVIGTRPIAAYLARDLLCVVDSEEFVRTMTPDMEGMLSLDGLLLHVTAPGVGTAAAGTNDNISAASVSTVGVTTSTITPPVFDCVSRSFAPKLNVVEDPVCGSGHCHIFPYWADRLGKNELIAYQASRRGGIIYGRLDGGRIAMSGKAVLFSKGEIYI